MSRAKDPKLAAIRLREKNRESRTLQGNVDVDVDMDDLVLGSMAGTMQKLMALSGDGGDVAVKIGDAEVTISRDSDMGWVDRLRGLGSLAQLVASDSRLDACKTLLEADGWVVAGGTIKTPSWMKHHEASIEDASGIAGLEWLGEV